MAEQAQAKSVETSRKSTAEFRPRPPPPVVDFQVHDEERAGGVDGGSFDLLGVLGGVRQSATDEQRGPVP
jgi:hypothetical protein